MPHRHTCGCRASSSFHLVGNVLLVDTVLLSELDNRFNIQEEWIFRREGRNSAVQHIGVAVKPAGELSINGLDHWDQSMFEVVILRAYLVLSRLSVRTFLRLRSTGCGTSARSHRDTISAQSLSNSTGFVRSVSVDFKAFTRSMATP